MQLSAPPRQGVRHLGTVALQAVGGLLAGALLVVVFVHLVDVAAVLRRLQHLRIGLAALCGVAFLGAYVVRAIRWRCLLRPCRVSLRLAIAIYQVSVFLNWLLPVRGGEIAMGLLLRRSTGIEMSRSMPSVTMDKSMDLLPALGLAAALPFAGLRLSGTLWSLLVLALVIIGCGTIVVVLATFQPERAATLLVRTVSALSRGRARAHAVTFVSRFVENLGLLVRQPKVLLAAVGLTVVAVTLDAVFCLLAFMAVGASVAIPVVLYGYTLYNLAFILPSPPGQIGSNELIGLLVFSGVFGLPRSEVGAMFVFSHPWTGLLMTCSGLACLSSMGLTLRGALRLAGKERR